MAIDIQDVYLGTVSGSGEERLSSGIAVSMSEIFHWVDFHLRSHLFLLSVIRGDETQKWLND